MKAVQNSFCECWVAIWLDSFDCKTDKQIYINGAEIYQM